VAFKESVCPGAARMHDPFRNAFMVEMGDLLPQDEVLEQRRTAQARLQRVLVVRYRHALVGGDALSGGIHAYAVQRTVGGVEPRWRSTGPGLFRTLCFSDRAGSDQ